jgi:uncharacterized membrane protein
MPSTTWFIAGSVFLLATAGWFLIRRRAAKRDDPREQNRRRKEEIAREVLAHGHSAEDRANSSLDDDLQRLRTLQGDRGGQSASPGASGGKDDANG